MHFNIRIVRHGDRYGLDNCLTHNDEKPLVEFYDPRYPHTPFGQFVSRYYVETLLAASAERGLCLDGGTPEWALSPLQFGEVQTTLRLALKVRP